jgi:hypothetical protein
VITVAGLPTVETDVLITAQAQAAPAVTGVKSVRVKPHRFNITFNPNGGAGASQDVDNVTYGSDAPITPPAFTKQNYNLLKWSAYEDGRDTITASPTAGALTGYEDAQTPGGRLHLYAIWQLAGAVAGQEENPDLMSKFGIKAPGYQASSITTADVSEAFNIIQAYIRTNITQSGSGQNMKLGDIKIGDYIMLPSLTVSDYTVLAAEPTYGTGGGGFTVSNPANLKVKVVGINPYAGKNGNGTDNHIVFQFEKSLLTRRINYVGSNHYYSITEVRRYLTPVDGESASGNFYNGLVNAGVPEGVFWNPVRVIGMRGGVTTVDTVNDKVFLLTLWEATGGAVDGNGYAITNGETSDNQGRLSAYNAGTVDASRIKYNLSGVAESWWVASPCSASPSMFCSASNVGKGGYTTAGGAYAGIAPAFCVK